MVAAVSTVVPISIPVGSSIAVTMDLPTYCLSSCYIYGFLGVQPGDSAAAEAYLGTNAGSANSKAFGISASERDAKIIQPARLFSISRADSAFTSACPSSGSFACTIKLVVNNTGSGTLDALATILADGNPIQDSKSVANTTARMAFALATGNSSFVTGDELRASIYKEAKKLDWAPRAIEMIWGAVAGWTQVIGATWQATHEAIVFNIIDTASTTPFIVSNYDYVSGGNSKNTLAVAGNSLGGLGGRFVAYGGNPLHDLQYPGRGSLWNAAFKQMVKNSVRWVLSDTTPSKITLAHIEDSYWFHHDNSTLYALKEFYPTATINGINACESANLATCLVGSDLLVISSSSDANTNFEAVTSAVYDFLLKGKPVLYLHFGSCELAFGTNEVDRDGLLTRRSDERR